MPSALSSSGATRGALTASPQLWGYPCPAQPAPCAPGERPQPLVPVPSSCPEQDTGDRAGGSDEQPQMSHVLVRDAVPVAGVSMAPSSLLATLVV